MKNSRGNKTTAQNLEEKFDRGEDVLDYFDLSKAPVVRPQPQNPARKKLTYSVKDDSHLRATVREKLARYRKKK
jgi:hypothetical protein